MRLEFAPSTFGRLRNVFHSQQPKRQELNFQNSDIGIAALDIPCPLPLVRCSMSVVRRLSLCLLLAFELLASPTSKLTERPPSGRGTWHVRGCVGLVNSLALFKFHAFFINAKKGWPLELGIHFMAQQRYNDVLHTGLSDSAAAGRQAILNGHLFYCCPFDKHNIWESDSIYILHSRSPLTPWTVCIDFECRLPFKWLLFRIYVRCRLLPLSCP